MYFTLPLFAGRNFSQEPCRDSSESNFAYRPGRLFSIICVAGEPAEDEGLLKGNQLHVLLLIYLTQRTLQMPQTVEKLKMARDCSRPVIVLREMDQRQERITKER
jgi:hypothetical protein